MSPRGTSGTAPVETNEKRTPSPSADAGARSLGMLGAYRHAKLLEAVAMAAKELLGSSDLSVSLPKVTEQIGCAAGVDRAHIFLMDRAAGEGHILQHDVWAVPELAM